MKLEEIVTSLELSKRLAELGVKQESIFVHCVFKKNNHEILLNEPDLLDKDIGYARSAKVYAAFTASELGNILSKQIFKDCKIYHLRIEPANRLGYWLVSYNNDIWAEERTEADARAKMLIYLVENKLIDPKEV